MVVHGCEEHKSRNSNGDECDTDIFVGRELATVEQDVHQHDGDEFAGFGQDHGWVVDVLQGGIREGRGDDSDEGDLEVLEGEGGRRAGERFALECEVDKCDGCGTEGLGEVEDDEELELLSVLSVGGC